MSSVEIDKISPAGNSIPLALRMRAAVATALGAAAAHAKLLADQEEREIEHLMTFIIEAQVEIHHCLLFSFNLNLFGKTLSFDTI